MIDKLKKQIEDSYYWDAQVKALDCNYFCDEMKLVFEDDNKDIIYLFEECYKINMEHPVEYPKDMPYKKLQYGQIPYFMQDVEVNEILLGEKKYLEFKIDMYPIALYIVCKKFTILNEWSFNNIIHKLRRYFYKCLETLKQRL